VKIFLVLLLLFASAAHAETRKCITRTPTIEARFLQLCSLVRARHPRPVPWSEHKCATWLFEYGMAEFREATRLDELNNSIRLTQSDLRVERMLEFGEVEPTPGATTPSPTTSPTVSPTATPTP